MTKAVVYLVDETNSIYTEIGKGAFPSRSSLHTEIGWVMK